MRRPLLFILAAALALAVLPAAATAAPERPTRLPGWGKGLDYDLDRVRQAMQAGAERVGPPPADAAEVFSEIPLHTFHPAESFTHTQPDGSTFVAHGLEFEEGGGQVVDDHFVARGEDGWWYYGTRQTDGRIAPTDAVVGRDEAPAETHRSNEPEAFQQMMVHVGKYAEQMNAYLRTRNATMAAEAGSVDEPVVFRIPALLFKVNDTDFQEESTPEKFEALYSGEGTSDTGTVTEMYLEQSFGHMVIQLDVYGPYEQSISNNPGNDCWYGTDGGPILGEFPEPLHPFTGSGLGLGGYGAKGMATEAVPQSDADVDYAQYDQDGNDYVDFLMIIHSGPGAETTGDPCDVHSHYFPGIGPAFGGPPEPTPVTADGKLIGPVLTVPEIDAQIGVVAHEIMHALGEPDYYGTTGTTGTGDWDLGAGGSYGGIPTQTNPLHFNPVMKINFGWVTPQRIDDTTDDVTLRPRATYPDMAMVPVREIPEGEEGHDLCAQSPISIVPEQNVNFYDEDGDCLAEGFLVENYSRTAAFSDGESCTFIPADFDRQGYGSGMMVWHWDFTNYQSLGNNNVLRPMLDIEEFDRRDAEQDLELGITRADPLDPFWGDPVGLSSATGESLTDVDLDPPDGSPYTVTAPVPGTSDTTEPWTVPDDIPEGVVMVVDLTWSTQDEDDWDLAVEKQDGEDWVDAGSDGAPPASGPESVAFIPEPGATYRAVATNFASASQTAEVHVTYDAAGVVKFGPASTLNAVHEATGWSFTNLRPNDYRGLAHAAERPGEVIVFDAIRHDDTTVDVSGDFLRVDREVPAPVRAGEKLTLVSRVYNHGGKAVTGATFELFDGDPADGGTRIGSHTLDLGAYTNDEVQFEFTPDAGLNELFVKATGAGDVAPGNDVVRTELVANPARDAAVLIVDNDRTWTQNETVEANLNALGVAYDLVEGEPSAETLKAYDAVIWLTTTVSGAQGVLSDEGYDAMVAYLDAGGDLWMSSNRAAGYHGTVGRTDVWATYFGFVPDNNILDPMGVMAGQGADIGGGREIAIGYVDGRPYLDYGRLTNDEDETQPKGTPTALFTHEQRPEGNNVVGVKLDGDGFRTVLTPSLTIVQAAEEQLRLTTEVLSFLGVATGEPTAQGVQVRFNRFQHLQVGQDWPVVVGAVAQQPVERVDLVYRTYGDDDWMTMTLDEAGPGLYGGTIPGSDVHNNGLEYYAQVTVGGITAPVDGGAAMPNVASAPYGAPGPVEYGACADASGAPAPGGDGEGVTGAPAGGSGSTPATGGGLAGLGALLIAAASAALRRGGRPRR